MASSWPSSSKLCLLSILERKKNKVERKRAMHYHRRLLGFPRHYYSARHANEVFKDFYAQKYQQILSDKKCSPFWIEASEIIFFLHRKWLIFDARKWDCRRPNPKILDSTPVSCNDVNITFGRVLNKICGCFGLLIHKERQWVLSGQVSKKYFDFY